MAAQAQGHAGHDRTRGNVSPACGTSASTLAITRSPPASRSRARRTVCSGGGKSAKVSPLRSAPRPALDQRHIMLPVVAHLRESPADETTGNMESSTGQDTGAGRTSVRANRCLPPGQTATLYGTGTGHRPHRPYEPHPQPAAIDDQASDSDGDDVKRSAAERDLAVKDAMNDDRHRPIGSWRVDRNGRAVEMALFKPL